MNSEFKLRAISPIDGRYSKVTAPLADYFSEEALIRYRIIIEGEYLIALSEQKGVGMRKLTVKEKEIIRSLYLQEIKNADSVKKYESVTNHDVKAVEYFIKEKLKTTSLKDVIEWTHFALTSEDTNNLAYACMLAEAVRDVIGPALDKVHSEIEGLARRYAKLPMLARTHGQSASPTTLGKEFAIFASRLERQIRVLKDYSILAKLNGATGNYNAHVAAFPKVKWIGFTKDFILGLNKFRNICLTPNLMTAQIEPHDTYAELFDIMRRINTILIDFNQDMWRYISDGWISQKPKEGEIGSSTMPHKINPIDFENSEGNLGLANSLFGFFSTKLPISRLQRDLTDSTVERNFGSAFAYSHIAYNATVRGLGKISANEMKISEDLAFHVEVIAEAIQTILRREGHPLPYEQLKKLTRGKKVGLDDFRKFIETLDIPKKLKKELLMITPENYIGLAANLSKGVK